MTLEDDIKQLTDKLWNIAQHDEVVHSMQEMRDLLRAFAERVREQEREAITKALRDAMEPFARRAI